MRIGIPAAALLMVAPLATATAPAVSTTMAHYSVSPVAIRATLPSVKPSSAAAPEIQITPEECLESFGYACQTPDSIRAAYDIPDTIGGKPAGTGQTIVIVTAFGSPTIASDLATFNADFALPDADLSVYYPSGQVTADISDDNQAGWAQETSLDVEWAHAIAPGAKIALVVSPSDSNDDLYVAQRYAIERRLGNVLSLSFGEPEALIHGNSADQAQLHALYMAAQRAGMTVVAASGDYGSDNGFGRANFAYPASDPLVTAVGGTTLFDGLNVRGPQETVWGDLHGCPFGCADGPYGATGGAPSYLYGKQGSDVAYDANPYTSYVVELGFYDDPDLDGTYFVGGTSAGAPQWAAIVAGLNQSSGRSLGYINDDLSSWAGRGALDDITSGDNETPTYSRGFSAGRGWDVPTGWGTPDVGDIMKQVNPRVSFTWKWRGPSWSWWPGYASFIRSYRH